MRLWRGTPVLHEVSVHRTAFVGSGRVLFEIWSISAFKTNGYFLRQVARPAFINSKKASHERISRLNSNHPGQPSL